MSNMNRNNSRTLLFKSIINNVVIRKGIFRYCIELNRILHLDHHYHLEWEDIMKTPFLLCQYGTLNQVKQLIECKLEPKYSKYKWFDHIDLINNSNNSSNDYNNNNKNNNDDIRYIPGLRGMLKGAIRGNRLEVVEYIYNRYKVFKDEIMYGLVEYSLLYENLHIAKHMIDHYDLKWPMTNISDDINKLPTETPDILEYYIDLEIKYNGKCLYPNELAQTSSSNGYLHILKRLCQLGISLNEQCLMNAAEHGHLHIVQFIHEHINIISSNFNNTYMYRGWNYSMSISAATKNKHNDIAKYLLNVKSVNQVVDKSVIKDASDSGNIEMVQYLLENKYSEIDTEIIISATRKGNLDMIKYFYQCYTEKCIVADPLKEAIKCNQLPIIQYIHQKNPQTIKSKYLLFNGVRNTYPTVVYCIENGLAYYDKLTYNTDSKSFMYIIQHSNHSLAYDMKMAISISQQDNDMELMEYLISHIGDDWDSIRGVFFNPNSSVSILQRLLEQVPKSFKEEWDFTNELIDLVEYQNLPLSTIKYIIDNFKIDKTRIASVIGGAVSRNNMDVFIYLLHIYDGDINSKGFTQIIESDESTNLRRYDMVNKEPIFIKHILENYDDGKRLNYKDITHAILENYNNYTFKYIKKMLLKTGKYNPNEIAIKDISPYQSKLFKYILKHTEKEMNINDDRIDDNVRNENDYITHYIIPLYNYYHRVGGIDIKLIYYGQYMDVVRFIYFNPIPTLAYKERTRSKSHQYKDTTSSHFRNDPKGKFFKTRNE